MPPQKKNTARLIVEGEDDKHSIIALLKRRGFNWDSGDETVPFIQVANGKPDLLQAVGAAIKNFGRPNHRVGFVLDADLSAEDSYRAVRGRAASSGVSLPEHLANSGTVVPGLLPTSAVGVWIMPDNTVRGTLEHFLQTLIPADDAVWNYAEVATTMARNLGAPLTQGDQLKGRLHAWLAWRETPGMPFGTAITSKALADDSPIADSFVNWFHRLFDIS